MSRKFIELRDVHGKYVLVNPDWIAYIEDFKENEVMIYFGVQNVVSRDQTHLIPHHFKESYESLKTKLGIE